jgi:hypothetical protein
VPICLLRDLAYFVVEHGVAGDPQRTVLLAVPAQDETDDVAGDRMAQRRSVAAWCRCDLDRGVARPFEDGSRACRQAVGVAPQPLGAGDGRQYLLCPGQERPGAGADRRLGAA